MSFWKSKWSTYGRRWDPDMTFVHPLLPLYLSELAAQTYNLPKIRWRQFYLLLSKNEMNLHWHKFFVLVGKQFNWAHLKIYFKKYFKAPRPCLGSLLVYNQKCSVWQYMLFKFPYWAVALTCKPWVLCCVCRFLNCVMISLWRMNCSSSTPVLLRRARESQSPLPRESLNLHPPFPSLYFTLVLLLSVTPNFQLYCSGIYNYCVNTPDLIVL